MENGRVIVSFHEKGFWQADYYQAARGLTGLEMDQMGLAPDGFCTFSWSVFPSHDRGHQSPTANA